MLGVALISVTLVPALIPMFIKGGCNGEEDNWIVRSFINIYKPLLDLGPAAAEPGHVAVRGPPDLGGRPVPHAGTVRPGCCRLGLEDLLLYRPGQCN